MRFVTNTPLSLKTSAGLIELKPGDAFTPRKISGVVELIPAGKVKPAESCHRCHEYNWWVSIYGVLICGFCHPPASKELIKIHIKSRSI
jgi:hypothetical protein